ncbi:MAG: tetratricopeptide repeat protein [Candidatus Latescibacteria bacterium]|nr:tetratricopeptide repeat protein [Candidatus Latescibacterota bacterium]
MALQIPTEPMAEVEALRLLIAETDGSVLAFALYGGVAEREAAVGRLKDSLNVPLVEHALEAGRSNPVELLQGEGAEERKCVCFYDIEEALPQVAGIVNLQREAFGQVPHASIFWVREYGLREMAEKAPDFWAWRSGVFDVRDEVVESGRLQALVGESLLGANRGELERKVSLYKGLLEEHSQKEKDGRFLAELWLRLANVQFNLGRLGEAETSAREGLEQSRKIGDKRMESSALNELGSSHLPQGDFKSALKYLEASLSISQKVGDRRSGGGALANISRIYQGLGDWSKALECLNESLSVFREVGDRRSEGTISNNIGQIYLDRGNWSKALEYLEESLVILREVGDCQGEGGTLNNIGLIYQDRGDWSKAQEYLEASLSIRRGGGIVLG